MIKTLPIDSRTDGISSVCFSPDSSFLLVSSWDGAATIYPVNAADSSYGIRHAHAGAVLCGSFGHSQDKCYTGGLDKIIRELDSKVEGSHRVLGKQEGPIRACEFSKFIGALVTGSWDQTIRLFDPRAATSEVGSASLVGKVFAMDVFETKAVVALSDGSLNTFDLRNLDVGPQLSRPNTIGHQVRSLAMFERGDAVLVGSIEGRAQSRIWIYHNRLLNDMLSNAIVWMKQFIQ